MAYQPIGGQISTVNSTATNLAISGVFTGTAEDVSQYAGITCSVFSSHASATDGLSLQQSTDGTNWDNIDAYTVPASTGKTFTVLPASKFFRVVYTNGATATTALRLQVTYRSVAQPGSSVRPQDARTNDNDMQEVLGYGMVYNNVTTNWDRDRKLYHTGRQTNSVYYNLAPTAVTATDALILLTNFRNGTVTAGTATPAVIATGRYYRITNISITYVGVATATTVRVTLRVNPAGVVAIGSPAVAQWSVGQPAAVAGVANSITVALPDGIEIAPGSGIGISVQGFSATMVGAVGGYPQVNITGYEY